MRSITEAFKDFLVGFGTVLVFTVLLLICQDVYNWIMSQPTFWEKITSIFVVAVTTISTTLVGYAVRSFEWK